MDGLIAGCRHKEETGRDGVGIPTGLSREARGRAELPAVAPQGQVDLELARCRHLKFRVSHRISSAVVSIDPIAPAGSATPLKHRPRAAQALRSTRIAKQGHNGADLR